jgi:hypothetical protein
MESDSESTATVEPRRRDRRGEDDDEGDGKGGRGGGGGNDDSKGGGGGGNSRPRYAHNIHEPSEPSRVLHLRNLPPDCLKYQFEDAMSQYGPVEVSVKVKNKDMALVQMKTLEGTSPSCPHTIPVFRLQSAPLLFVTGDLSGSGQFSSSLFPTKI